MAKNLPPLETLISRVFSKRKAISCVGVCIFASFLIFTLLYVGNDEGAVTSESSSSLVLWIFSFNDAGRENNILFQGADLGNTSYFSSAQKENMGKKEDISIKEDMGKTEMSRVKTSIHSNENFIEAENLPCKSNGGRKSADCGEKQSNDDVFNKGTISGNNGEDIMRGWLDRECDIFNGRWVKDDSKPLYPPRLCPFIDPDFNCHENGRPDEDFLRWRWKSNECDIPSFNAPDFLKRLKGQRLIFVGDSLNRNMWESLVCILRESSKNKSRVYEISGRRQFKTSGYYSFIFKDYNCSVDFVRSPFLVKEVFNGSHVSESDRLRLDLLDDTTSAYRTADIVVFNTGHWWTHEKTSKGVNYYQEGDRLYTILDVVEAYKRALLTWARWVDENIDPEKTQIVFRGYSLTHFSGGQWNSGGQCHEETEPISDENFTRKHPEKMKILEQVLKRMKTSVIYLNISRLTDYRKDGHPSIYRSTFKTSTHQVNAQKTQDCSHWCLPGVPDTWNELLYASLLKSGKGSWGAP